MKRSTYPYRHVSTLTALLVGGAAALVMPARAAEPAKAAARGTGTRAVAARTVVDSAVRPAGGMVCGECGPTGCRHGKLCHHRDCKDGVCVPHCPVRPGTFGFYGTQWRRWPGQGVVPASNVEAATPVKPPKSEVPGVDEESFGPKPDDLPEPTAPDRGADESAARPMPPEPDAPAAAPRPVPDAAEAPAPEPRDLPVEAPEPSSQPAVDEAPPAKPKAGDLFDESAARRVRRKIPIQAGTAAPAQPRGAGGVMPTSHEAAGTSRRAVPRVAFDPEAESARLRQVR